MHVRLESLIGYGAAALLATLLATLLAACGGGGGGVPESPVAKAPAQPLPTSYQNFKAVGLLPQWLPGGAGGNGVIRAYGDFTGRGKLDLFTAALTYSADRGIAAATPSRLEIWSRDDNGSWTQAGALLSTTQGCIHPRRAIVADFNGDKRPDVFLACHGFDAAPFPGERNLIVLSQPNGGFLVKAAANDVGFFHAASAADLNADGLPDVVVTNNFDPASVYAFINKGNGVFEREAIARFPASLRGKGLFTVELVDVNEDGLPDALVGGHEWDGTTTVALINPGNYQFAQATAVTLPAVPGEGVVLDFAVTGSGATRAIWVLRTSGGDGSFYQSRTVQRIQWPSLASTTPLRQRPAAWFPWIIPAVIDGVGYVASEEASVGVRLPQ